MTSTMQEVNKARRTAAAREATNRTGYAIVSPCRDEAKYMRQTLDSIVGQAIPPSLWVIVDDGSTDQTPAILAEYAAKYDFIRVVRREDRGRRNVGPGVIDAFYAGLQTVDLRNYRFIAKVDLDLDLPNNYFEELMRRMDADPRLGTCSGKPYFRHPRTNRLVSEKCGDDMSVGMTKFYRMACFMQIGGFVREVMWDGIDCHRCRMFGWKACSWDDPELRFIHLRPMGSSQQSIWAGRMRHGRGQYFMGSSLAYMTASAIFRMTRPPLILDRLAMWWGFVRAMLSRQLRYEDHAFRKFLRCYQWSVLLRGRRRALRRLDAAQHSSWRAPSVGSAAPTRGEGVAAIQAAS